MNPGQTIALPGKTHASRAGGLAAYLGFIAVIAFAILEVNQLYSWRLMGYAITPGQWLAWAVVAMTAYSVLRRNNIGQSLAIMGLYLAVLFLEYLPLSRNAWEWIGISLALLGATMVYSNPKSDFTLKGFFLLLTAYLLSVFVYNMFRGEQLTRFFQPGFTT